MPENTKTNQQNELEHQTHVPALIFLIAVTAVVSVISLSLGASTAGSGSVTADKSGSQADASIAGADPEPVETVDDLPSGLIAEDTSVVRNRALELGEHKQRIVVVNTRSSSDNIQDRYRQWFQQNDYKITETEMNRTGGSFVATKDSEKMIIVFSQQNQQASARVQLNYIAGARSSS